tara:strand:+ start:2994 stop:3290 length:297 start_codon:yes stop_codon:yes gene_type:complete
MAKHDGKNLKTNILAAITAIDPTRECSQTVAEDGTEKFSDVVFENGNPNKITSAQVEDKRKELIAAEDKKKSDKVSAYRKMGMTDDEINALDPTLLQE